MDQGLLRMVSFEWLTSKISMLSIFCLWLTNNLHRLETSRKLGVWTARTGKILRSLSSSPMWKVRARGPKWLCQGHGGMQQCETANVVI